MKFSVAISHTPWIAARAESYSRLVTWLQLGPAWDLHPAIASVKTFDDKEPNWAWSAKMWAWAASQAEATHCLFLQDDVIPMPGFFDALTAMVAARPTDIIGLETAHPAAPMLAEEGFPWMTTADGLIGVAYVVPRALLESFLNWRIGLRTGAIQAISEDSLLGIYAAVRGLKVFHPIPTIIDHDISIPSTYGNDDHPRRSPSVKWEEENMSALAHPDEWMWDGPPPHLGVYYESTPRLISQWVPDSAAKDATLSRLKQDSGKGEARRIWFAKRARSPNPTRSIWIGIPNRGGIHPETAATVWRLRNEEFLTEWDMADVHQISADICRIRARMVRLFLESSCSHLLFLDSDVAAPAEAIRNMLAANREFIAAPYPRRDVIDFKTLRQHAQDQETPSEALAYRYSAQLGPSIDVDHLGVADAIGMPLGCALISRGLLEKMVAHFGYDLTFQDEPLPGQKIPTVGLFNLLISKETGGLLSEDYSFCARVREVGAKVEIYLGPGSPVSHWGSWGYHGKIESFGYRREEVR